MPIRELPPLLINQIAAGEVIERPASVVKELLENAVDADAGTIELEIEDGGTTLIRIRDDGCGIPADELPLALTQHATSKLPDAASLDAILTLGFRGEALASIASVSRLRISSLARVDGRAAAAGAVIEQAGDTRTGPSPAALAPGTVVEVRDLFFNTPARRRFLRAASAEMAQITDTLTRAALTHPHLAFRCTHNGRTTLDLPADQSRRERCVAVLGRDLEDALLEFEHVDPRDPDAPAAWCLVAPPSLARGTAKAQYVCINGRPVRDRRLGHALKEGFRGLIPPDRYPVGVVHLTLDPTQVDVNVHPTKAEVRFRNPSGMFKLVQSCVRAALGQEDLTPVFRTREPPPHPEPAEAGEPARDAPGVRHAGAFGTFDASGGGIATAPGSGAGTDAFVDYFRRMAPAQKGIVYSEVRQQMDAAVDAAPDAAPAREAAPAPTPPVQRLKILQAHGSYVVVEDPVGILIIDQHALHERVMFEKLRARILDQGHPLESQRLLMPVTVRADALRQELAAGLTPLFTLIGMDVSPIGPETLAIQAFPSLLFTRGVEAGPFLDELIDAAEAGLLDPAESTASESAIHAVLDMMSCKAAVKAGDRLSDEELVALLEQREQVERSSNCPHGRPTTLRISLADLEKQFGRT